MRVRGVLLIAAGSLLLSLPPSPARAESYKDERLGYTFAFPSKWNQVPVDTGTTLVARFSSNREYEWVDPAHRGWDHHRPSIDVVRFPVSPPGAAAGAPPAAPPAAPGARPEPAGPPKTFREYLDSSLSGRGGAGRLVAQDEATVNGLKVLRYEYSVPRQGGGERRVFAWEIATEDAVFGLVAEILAQEEKKLKPDIFQSFSTFRTVPRTGKPDAGGAGGAADAAKPASADLTPEEMKKRRQDATRQALDRIRLNLPPDWSVSESRNFVAVSHADPKFTRELLAHAEALRAWLEAEMGFVGSGYAGQVILRICASRQEHQAFLQGRGWNPAAPEVLTFKDRDGWLDWHLQELNREIARFWIRDKNDRLEWGLPEWLAWGIRDYVGRGKMKGGRMEFKADTWDSVEMKTMRRSDSLLKPRDFFTMTSADLWNFKGITVQDQFFVNFLLAGAASKSPKYRTVLTDYLKNIIFLLDTENLPALPGGKAPQNEQEEMEALRVLRDQWRAKEPQVLDTLLQKTFPGWTDKDWDAFNGLYRQDLR